MYVTIIVCFALFAAPAQKPTQARTKATNTSITEVVSNALEAVRPAIVQIKTEVEYSIVELPGQIRTGVSTGSGFFLDSAGHVGTASHVVDIGKLRNTFTSLHRSSSRHQTVDQQTFRIKQIIVGVPLPDAEVASNVIAGNFSTVPATILRVDQRADIAILTPTTNPFTTSFPAPLTVSGRSFAPRPIVPQFYVQRPRDGDMISVSGFPLNIAVMVTNTGWIASGWYVDVDNRQRLYLGDIQVNHGNSGGPVYRVADGAIIGVVVQFRNTPESITSGLEINSGLSVIVPIQRVLDLLKSVK
jgi:S1-C subfamily serine protease